jgi:hypothetical protein
MAAALQAAQKLLTETEDVSGHDFSRAANLLKRKWAFATAGSCSRFLDSNRRFSAASLFADLSKSAGSDDEFGLEEPGAEGRSPSHRIQGP